MEFTREYLNEQFDSIDASVFSGDAFLESKNIEAFEFFIERWQRKINTYKNIIDEIESED